MPEPAAEAMTAGRRRGPLHVGLDLLFLVPGESGGRETYTLRLVEAMRELAGEDVRFTAFLNRETEHVPWPDGVEAVRMPVSARSRPSWAIGEVALVAGAAARARVDVLHGVANFAPAFGPFGRVITVHDVLHRERPDMVPGPVRIATAALMEPAVHRAHRIITVSEAARRDITRHLGIDAGRIEVIPNGVEPPSSAGVPARGRAMLAAGDRAVVLSVGTALPHKNLVTLVDAVAAMDRGERPLLAMAGQATDTDPALLARIERAGIGDDVRLLGRVSDAALEDLYAAADVLALPTRHEGFGLPVIEAMARGLPVVCSDLPVLREVAGAGARFFDPDDAVAVSSALRAALTDGDRTRALVALGARQAEQYRWQRAAAATLETYRRVDAQRGAGRTPDAAVRHDGRR